MDIPRRMLRGALLLIAGLPPAGLASAQSQNAAPAAKCPPAARIDSAKDTYGSTVVADPYRWLEDQDSPETRAWISAEQSCTEASLSKLPGRAQLAVRLTANGPDELLIDPLPWTPDHSASVTLENVSRDGKFVFYGRRDGGRDEITPRVLEVDAKTTLPDAFPAARYFGMEPTPDNKAFYYSRVTPDGPRAFFHRMGPIPPKTP